MTVRRMQSGLRSSCWRSVDRWRLRQCRLSMSDVVKPQRRRRRPTPSCHTHNTHTYRLTALCPGLPTWAGTRKVKPIWILLKQETVSGSGISWAICKSAPCSRQITMPAPHHSVFYRPDALPVARPSASKHWRQLTTQSLHLSNVTTGQSQ